MLGISYVKRSLYTLHLVPYHKSETTSIRVNQAMQKVLVNTLGRRQNGRLCADDISNLIFVWRLFNSYWNLAKYFSCFAIADISTILYVYFSVKTRNLLSFSAIVICAKNGLSRAIHTMILVLSLPVIYIWTYVIILLNQHMVAFCGIIIEFRQPSNISHTKSQKLNVPQSIEARC